MPVLQPQLHVNGVALNNRLSCEILWKQTEGLFDGSALEPGSTIPTFDGPAKVRSGDMAYQPRRLVITGRIINRGGWMDKQKAIADLAQVFAGRPAIVRLGTLYIEAEFGPVKLVDDAYSHLPGYQTWRVEGEAIPGTYYGQYHTALGADQGLAVQDDRPDSSAVKFTSNSFTYTNPGTAPTEACVSLTGTASTVYYLKGRGLRRVPMTTDSAGNATIDEASGFIVYPGSNAIRVEDSAGALAAGITAVTLYGTRPRFLGNSPTAATTQSATTNRMSEGPMLTVARTGPKTYINTAGTLSTATDGQPAIGLPWVARRNLFTSSLNPLDSYWSKGETAPFSLNAAANPVSGTVDAVKWTAQAGAVGHFFKRALFALVSATTYTLSIYVKKGSYRYFGLVPGTSAGGYTTFDLDTGTWTNYSTGVTAGDVTATPLADGWWRLSVRCAASGAADVNFAMPSSNGSTSGWTAAGTEHVYFWTPQIEVGSSASAPQPTNSSGADLTHPVNGAGLVLEGASTNILTSNQATGTDAIGNTTGFASTEGGFWLNSSNPAALSSDTATVYQGSRSLKVVCNGANSAQGVALSASSVAAAANTRHTAQVRFSAPAGTQLQIEARDYTNGLTFDGAVYTATGGWDLATITFTTGAAAVTDLRFGMRTASAVAVTFYVDALKIEAGPFPTSWHDGTRQPDLCGIVYPHNLLRYSEQFDNAAWAKSNFTVSASAIAAPDGTTTADSLAATTAFCRAYQSGTINPYGKTLTYSVWLKISSGSPLVTINFRNQAASYKTGVSTKVSTSWQRFIVTYSGWAPTDTDCMVEVACETNGQVIYAWGAQLAEGSHPGVYVRTTDTPIPAPTSPALDPAWVQNGKLRGRFVLPSGANVAAGTAILGYVGGILITQFASTITLSRVTAGGTRSVSIALNAADGAPHSYEASWSNYTDSSGVRSMVLSLAVDALTSTANVAALYGDLAWSALDASTLVSRGTVNATLSAPGDGQMISYPTLPAGAIPAT